MKNITLSRFFLNSVFMLTFLLVFTVSCAQKSPPAKAEASVNGVEIQIKYNSPRVKGRIVWGDLVAYDQVWRTGANEATIFEVDKDVVIEGNKVPAGSYSLFTIPKKGDSWTVILNKVPEQWGAYKYDPEKDLMRFTVDTERTIEMKEEMTFDISESGAVTFTWEYLTFDFQVGTK